MTPERKKDLFDLIVGDLENTKHLFSLEPKEVLKILRGKGYDYTEDELIEFLDDLKKMTVQSDEINGRLLDNITGGTDIQVKDCQAVFINLCLREAINNCTWNHSR